MFQRRCFLLVYVICVSCMSCCLVCSLQPCGHLLGKGSSCAFVTFPYDVLGQVWYLIGSIPAICLISYYVYHSTHLVHPASRNNVHAHVRVCVLFYAAIIQHKCLRFVHLSHVLHVLCTCN